MPTFESFKSGAQFSGRGIAIDPLEMTPNSITSNFLADLDPDPAGSYDWGVVNSKGLVTSGSNVSAIGYAIQEVSGATLIAKSGSVTYVKPASPGSVGIITLDTWISFKAIILILTSGTDYNSSNPFVLNFVDSSGLSNSWDPSDEDPAFDLVVPNVQPLDAGATATPLFLKQATAFGVSEDWRPNISWLSSTLTMTFNKTQFLGKSRNILKITL